jgi:hypothetical protein
MAFNNLGIASRTVFFPLYQPCPLSNQLCIASRTVLVFRQNVALVDAIGFHTRSLEALACV